MLFILAACSSDTPTGSNSPTGPAPNSLKPDVVSKSSVHQDDSEQQPTSSDLQNAITSHGVESVGCSEALTWEKGGEGLNDCASSGRGAIFSRVELQVFQGGDTFGAQYFFMMTTEVTQGFYQKVMGSPLDTSQCNVKGNSADLSPNQPAYCISWLDAVKFANALSEQLNLETCYQVERSSKIWPNSLECKGFRLPTPVEWSWAFKGNGVSSVVGLNERVWHQGNSNSRTHSVASLKPNGFGLYDLAGNVSEWVYEDPDPGPNRQVLGGEHRVYRGGSAGDGTELVIKGAKGDAHYSHKDAGVGFRLVRTAD